MEKDSYLLADNDVYLLCVVKDRILINDNYDGIIIVSYDFSEKWRVRLFPDMSIDMAVSKGVEVLLCCCENQCFVYVNVNTFQIKVIPFPPLEDIILTPAFAWKNGVVVLSDYKKELYEINLYNGAVRRFQSKSLEVAMGIIKLNGLYRMNYSSGYAIFRDDAFSTSAEIMNLNTKEISLYEVRKESHDFDVNEECFVDIAERSLILWTGENRKEFYPQNGYYTFGRLMEVQDKNYLFALSIFDEKTKGNNGKTRWSRNSRIERIRCIV